MLIPVDESWADCGIELLHHLLSAENHCLQTLGRSSPHLPAHIIIIRVLVITAILVTILITLHVTVLLVIIVVVGVVGDVLQTQVHDGRNVS